MSRRNLSTDEITRAKTLVEEVRARLGALSQGDEALLFAYRRYLYIRLTYDERGNPTERNKLKAYKLGEQQGRCALCKEPLPDKYAVLDRLVAASGYTKENTRLIHQDCDIRQQQQKRYA